MARHQRSIVLTFRMAVLPITFARSLLAPFCVHSMYSTTTVEGNQMLREIVRDNVPRYVAAKSKHEKGEIIVEILETIKAKSPSGLGLLRQNPDTKRWFYIGTDKAKDKIGHALRKASRDLSNGVKGSPIKQQKRRGSSSSSIAASHRPHHNGQSHPSASNVLPPLPRHPSTLASPRSAFRARRASSTTPGFPAVGTSPSRS